MLSKVILSLRTGGKFITCSWESEGEIIIRGPFYWHRFTLIPAWISKHIHYKVWDKITYLFPNFNGCTVEVWEWMRNFMPHITNPCWDWNETMLVKYAPIQILWQQTTNVASQTMVLGFVLTHRGLFLTPYWSLGYLKKIWMPFCEHPMVPMDS